MDVDRAFREWCAVLDFAPTSPRGAGGYRLGKTPDGKVQIERRLADGSIEVIAPPMTESAFCDAVQLVRATFGIKTVQVARTVAKRKRGR